jgi:hypothetical protein
MYKWVAIAFLLFVIGGTAFYYYKSTQNTIATLLTERATLQENVRLIENANRMNLETIDQMDRLYAENLRNFNHLQEEFQAIRSRNNESRERINNRVTSAISSPSETEININESFRNNFRCFELLSGSPLTQRERESRSSLEFNPECPWLFEQRRGNSNE